MLISTVNNFQLIMKNINETKSNIRNYIVNLIMMLIIKILKLQRIYCKKYLS